MIKKLLKQNHQPFNDGVVRIYRVDNIAPPGNQPKDGLTQKHSLRYQERKVGLTRYHNALQNDVKVEMVLRVPRLPDVSTQDIAVPNNGRQYEIVQMQYPDDITPPVMDLTLARLERREGEYDIT